jgi:hypothetical protein
MCPTTDSGKPNSTVEDGDAPDSSLQPTEADISRAWDYFRHEDVILAARTAYGMAVESMLLLSYSAIFAVQGASSTTGGLSGIGGSVVEASIAVFGSWYSFRGCGMIDSVERRKSRLRKILFQEPVFAYYWPDASNDTRHRRTILVAMGFGWIVLAAISILFAAWPIAVRFLVS